MIDRRILQIPDSVIKHNPQGDSLKSEFGLTKLEMVPPPAILTSHNPQPEQIQREVTLLTFSKTIKAWANGVLQNARTINEIGAICLELFGLSHLIEGHQSVLGSLRKSSSPFSYIATAAGENEKELLVQLGEYLDEANKTTLKLTERRLGLCRSALGHGVLMIVFPSPRGGFPETIFLPREIALLLKTIAKQQLETARLPKDELR